MTRRLTGLGGGLLLGVMALAGLGFAQDATPLPPLEQCQAERLQLQAALVEWQRRAVDAEAQLAQRVLADQRQQFEARLRDTVTPPAGSRFDWTQLRFVAPKGQP